MVFPLINFGETVAIAESIYTLMTAFFWTKVGAIVFEFAGGDWVPLCHVSIMFNG